MSKTGEFVIDQQLRNLEESIPKNDEAFLRSVSNDNFYSDLWGNPLDEGTWSLDQKGTIKENTIFQQEFETANFTELAA